MLNFTRSAALALAFAFSQLQLGGVSGHGTSTAATAMADMRMPTVDAAPQAQSAGEAPCEHCTTPEGGAPQCDEPAARDGCMSTGACATTSAVLDAAALSVNASAGRAIAAHVLIPRSPSLSQDTPPPRA